MLYPIDEFDPASGDAPVLVRRDVRQILGFYSADDAPEVANVLDGILHQPILPFCWAGRKPVGAIIGIDVEMADLATFDMIFDVGDRSQVFDYLVGQYGLPPLYEAQDARHQRHHTWAHLTPQISFVDFVPAVGFAVVFDYVGGLVEHMPNGVRHVAH